MKEVHGAWDGASATQLFTRRAALDAGLDSWGWLWRSQPFKEPYPEWCEQLPGLARALTKLDDGGLARLAQQPEALSVFLTGYVPELEALLRLTTLPSVTANTPLDSGTRLRVGVPGRKRAQIEALAATVTPSDAPLLEWCGGKGHLGRLLAARWKQPVLTVERNAQLCAQGERLAARGHVTQDFLVADALGDTALRATAGRHVIALHACGELHRTLVRQAARATIPAIDLAPCCYHHMSSSPYSPLCNQGKLSVTRDDLRLAVTDTVTAGQRVIRQRDQDMAWKLGFISLRGEVHGATVYHPMLPVPKRWLTYGFEGYCRALAQREGVALPEVVNWNNLERDAWARQARVMRLSLVRHGFRRVLELWLVLDLACYLVQHGYRVSVGTFCHWRTTPRNILLSARC